MIICKNFDKNMMITTVEEWFEKCPPVGEEEHWKDGRSAKELAKDWIVNEGEELKKTLGSNIEFKDIIFEEASPEYTTKLDNFRGNGRQHDLLILASVKNKPLLISIEAKADESFGKITKDYYIEQIKERDKEDGKNTNVPERIEGLIKYVFNENVSYKDINNEVFKLRYQLLHGVAGTIMEAEKREIKRAIFHINIYRSTDENAFKIKKYNTNTKDLDRFISYLSKKKINNISNDELIGPFNIHNIDLYISKSEKLI